MAYIKGIFCPNADKTIAELVKTSTNLQKGLYRTNKKHIAFLNMVLKSRITISPPLDCVFNILHYSQKQ